MVMSSGTNTPSVSGGLQYAPSALDVCLEDYTASLDTKRIIATTVKGDAETMYDAGNGLDRHGAWFLGTSLNSLGWMRRSPAEQRHSLCRHAFLAMQRRVLIRGEADRCY